MGSKDFNLLARVQTQNKRRDVFGVNSFILGQIDLHFQDT